MEDNKNITIGKIFVVAFRRWKLFVPIAVLIAAIGSLLIIFIYNPYKANYVSNFTYTSLDLQENKYADGSTFSYGKLVNLGNLQAIKDSNEKYVSIDVEKLASKDKIKISRELEKDSSNNESGTYIYTISMNRKYFSSFELASSFAYDIAYSAIAEDQKKIDNFNVGQGVASFDTAKTFEEQISALSNQATTLDKLYETITEPSNKDVTYPAFIYSMALENKLHLESSFSSRNETSLKAEISEYGFVKDYSVVDLAAQKTSLEQEKSDNEAVLKVYTDQITAMGSGSALTELPKVVDNLTRRNSEIATELIAIDAKIANKPLYDAQNPDYMAKYNAFVSELKKYKQTIVDETENYKQFLTKAYIDSGTIDFENTAIIEQKGNVNTAIAVVISVLVGVITGAVVNLIVDKKKLYE